jgi:hypothetical protein
VADETPDRAEARQRRDEEERKQRAAAAARIAQKTTWVDLQLRQAVERGDFENLPGYGKPLRNLTGEHDPDWWVKQLVEREQITGVVPPSLLMRREDAELDGRLDRLATEREVRREVEEFNARVRWALYRPPEGPPMLTPQRDVETEVERWAERRRRRLEERRARQAEADARSAAPSPPRRRWPWRRRVH